MHIVGVCVCVYSSNIEPSCSHVNVQQTKLLGIKLEYYQYYCVDLIMLYVCVHWGLMIVANNYKITSST